MAYALASASTHPLSRALAAHIGHGRPFAGTVSESAGRGVEGVVDGVTWRLGSRDWCGLPAAGAAGPRW